MDELSKLFGAYDRGSMSRRHLLQALGVAGVGAAGVALPIARLFGQGSCAGSARDTTAACNKTLAKAPFESTGWKTVLLDHFNMQVTDVQQEAAYYNALMGWKVRSNDGNEVMMDIGDWGGVRIRGGYVPVARAGGAGGAGRGGAGGAGGAGGRGGAGRGGAPGDSAAAARAARPPRADTNHLAACTTAMTPAIPNSGVSWDGFCWGISGWDTKKVEAALKQRNLDPVADHDAKKDFYSFHVKDPDGFDVQISNGNKKNRRTTPATGKANVPLPFEPTGWTTKYLDHISFGVTDYKATVAFYTALLGWKGLGDEGSQNETEIAPEIGGLLIRGPNSLNPTFVMPGARRASMGHISFGIANFDPDKVNAELCKRGLSARPDTGAVDSSADSEKNIHTATYKSFHTRTPNGFDLQISDKISAATSLGAPGTSGAKIPGSQR